MAFSEDLVIPLILACIVGIIIGFVLRRGFVFGLLSGFSAGLLAVIFFPILGTMIFGEMTTVWGAVLGAVIVTLLADQILPQTEKRTNLIPAAEIVNKPAENLIGKIFVSYRRDDSLDQTSRIYDRLVTAFGPDNILRDIDAIPIGYDFRRHIERMVSTCEVCIAVIGNRWLTVTDSSGARRLDDPMDYVRLEIEAALKRDVRVVPLLTGGASMPSPQDLPESLRELAFRNGMPVRPDPDFHRDVDRLVAQLTMRTPAS